MNTELHPFIITIMATHFVALLSPGPDFALVVRTGIKNHFYHSIFLSLGISFANLVIITTCIFGLSQTIKDSVLLMTIIKTFGVAFLSFISVKLCLKKRNDYKDIDFKGEQEKSTYKNSFFLGFLSGITNPKNLLFYMGLFAFIFQKSISTKPIVFMGLWMSFLVFFWNCLISMIFKIKCINNSSKKLLFHIDKLVGIFLGFLSINLILTF
ncbi:MAG: LysE family translocator [Spirochaetales bacterium]|nr:LysE family translocator [Spirochaetales bacterium]